MHASITLQGPQGAGKNTVARAVGRIYGKYWVEISTKQLYARFNCPLEDKMFVVGNEIVATSNRDSIEKLKDFISAPTIYIEHKNVDEYEQPNSINFLFTTNNPQPFHVPNDDRRFFFHSIDHTKEECESSEAKSFFKRIHEMIDQDSEIAALHARLLEVDLRDFSPYGHAPMTTAKQEIVEMSRSEMERWLRDLPKVLPKLVTENAKVMELNYTKTPYLFTVNDLWSLWQATRNGSITWRERSHAVDNNLPLAGYKKAHAGGQIKINGHPERLWIITYDSELIARLQAKQVCPSDVAEEYLNQWRTEETKS